MTTDKKILFFAGVGAATILQLRAKRSRKQQNEPFNEQNSFVLITDNEQSNCVRTFAKINSALRRYNVAPDFKRKRQLQASLLRPFSISRFLNQKS